ncbi:MAG: L,D-transpeptidase [Candidatus Scatovivens sp.]
MKLSKHLKHVPKKQKIIIAIVILLIIVIITSVLAIVNVKNKKKMESLKNLSNKIEVPNVTEENTKFIYSTLEETESNVVITLEKKLEEYNLYYLVNNNVNTNEEGRLYEVSDTAIAIENSTGDTTNNIPINKNDFKQYKLFENEINIEENCIIYFVYEKEGKYSQDIYEMQITNIIESFTEEASEEEIEAAKVDKNSASNSKSPYYIKVNYGANVVTIYTKDENGNYTVPVKAMVCSCGTGTPRSGVYKTSRGYQWGALFGGVYGMYSTRIVGHILFHSVPYTSPSNDCLEWWEFDKLGTKASMGCIRLQVADSKWIFNNCSSGTMVEFYSSSDPGPLGKPSAPKISNNEKCRNWDPTDDTSGNPWFIGEEEITPEDVISGDTTSGEIITDDTILTD